MGNIAWTGSAVVIVGLDSPNSNLNAWWQPEGATGWNLQAVATGAGNLWYVQSAIAWTGSSLIIAAMDSLGNLTYFSGTSDATNWYPEIVAMESPPAVGINDGLSYSQPAIAWTGNSPIIAALDSNGALHYWQREGGGWYEQTLPTSESVEYGPLAIGWTGSFLAIVAADSSGALDYWSQDGAGGWNQQTLPSAMTEAGFSSPAIALAGGTLVITAAGVSGNLYYWWRADTGEWNQQTVLSASEFDSVQSAIAWTGQNVVIAAVDTWNGALRYCWQADGTKPWHNQEVRVNLVNGAKQFLQPDIAWTGKAVVITVPDDFADIYAWSDSLWRVTSRRQSNWHQQTVYSIASP
jgi:hypothetical protein